MTEIPAKLFQESHIVSVTFPEGVTSIGADAFRQIPELEEVTLPASLQTIGNQAFRDCPNLKTINLLFVQAT